MILLFNVTLPQNYRPISLLPVGYKVLAALIHQRLIECGVDDSICSSQYGFRPKRGCGDALMIIRRMIDAAYESTREGLMMVFLDWAKAFDSVSPEAMATSLRRFGCPAKFVDMVAAIYDDRKFVVSDFGADSGSGGKALASAKGARCPLSCSPSS